MLTLHHIHSTNLIIISPYTTKWVSSSSLSLNSKIRCGALSPRPPDSGPPSDDDQDTNSVPSDIYREISRNTSKWEVSIDETGPNIVESNEKYMEEAECWLEINREPIIADQHIGLVICLDSKHTGWSSPFPDATIQSIFNTATPTNWQHQGIALGVLIGYCRCQCLRQLQNCYPLTVALV
ncbi:hypothetical protein Tco_0162597 [Tanacetum coccineum]